MLQKNEIIERMKASEEQKHRKMKDCSENDSFGGHDEFDNGRQAQRRI